jgi:hypothetical protein
MSHDLAMKEPVDAVITWVDGHDKAHAEKLAACLATLGFKHRPKAAAPTRFNQQGELDYCVHSLLRFAPWLRTIYIVTDAQTPSLMQELAGTPHDSKVKLIDHRDIFFDFEHCLPTFNSLAIESVLWRIKGIADHFIYFNDDCFLIRPVSYEDFFCGHKLVLRGHWKTQTEKKWCTYFKTLKPSEHREIQENSAKLSGWHKRFFHLPHVPFPIKKTTLENFFRQQPELLAQNINYPLRHKQQFWPISLAHHLEIKTRNIVFDNTLEAIIVNPAYHSLRKIKNRLAQADKKKKVSFICMQSMDIASEKTRMLMFNWLAEKIL